MNFLQAVQALKEGKCGGIKLNSTFFNGDEFRVDLIELFSNNWELVNEVKQYEEVEVVRWLSYDGNLFLKQITDEDIKLTGKIKREIKPKIKRRKEFLNAAELKHCSWNIPENAIIAVEWEE